jgi:CTP:phosphocholine cytidylyltransferase-like protein
MSRFTRKIRAKNQPEIQVLILAAGASARTRSYEPRCLLKYEGVSLLDRQMQAVQNYILKNEISVVGGIEGQKILRRIYGKYRFIENQNHETSNNGESLRLGVNNSVLDNLLFFHGDLILDENLFKGVSFDRSFIMVDRAGQIAKKEIGANVVDEQLQILSYDLPVKWCQVAYLAKPELDILKRLFLRHDIDFRYLLTFEVLNKMLDNGASFECVDVKNKFIREVDSLKDLNT